MKKVLSAILILICGVAIFIPQVSAEDWVWIYSDSDHTDYVDNDSISRGDSYSDYDFKAVIKSQHNDYSEMRKNSDVSSIIGWYYFKNVNDVVYCKAGDLAAYDKNGNYLGGAFSSDWGLSIEMLLHLSLIITFTQEFAENKILGGFENEKSFVGNFSDFHPALRSMKF